jgi:hypothetical protein
MTHRAIILVSSSTPVREQRWSFRVLPAVFMLISFGLAQNTNEVDPRSEVAAALYAASATQAAAERIADSKLRVKRAEIERLRIEIKAGEARHQSELTAAEESYVAAISEQDRVYAQQIASFRNAVQDIAATPKGAAALARFNSGDENSALAILDDLRKADDAARKKLPISKARRRGDASLLR